MRCLSAHFILPITSPPLKMGIICLDDAGVITDIIDTEGNLKESEKVEFYNGILVPGLIDIRQQGHGSSVLFHAEATDEHVGIKTTSDTQLSVFEEIKNICQTSADISLEQMLRRVTWDEAKIRGIDKISGSFEIGKKPGVALISSVHYDCGSFSLTRQSKYKVLIDPSHKAILSGKFYC